MGRMSFALRRLVWNGSRALSAVPRSENMVLSCTAASYVTVAIADEYTRGFAFNSSSVYRPPVFSTQFRGFSNPPATESSNVVVIETVEQFDDSLRKVQDESLPAIFYFTAVWCGPCRLLSPIIGQLSEQYPHVTTYKVDIDKKGLQNALGKLNIHSVPTLHFFHNGKKASEVVGADVQQLRKTMESLYK